MELIVAAGLLDISGQWQDADDGGAPGCSCSRLRMRLNLFLKKASGAVSRQPLMWQEPDEVLNTMTGIPKSSLPM